MDPKNSRLYGGNDAYFIEDQYKKDAHFDCKDTIFDYEDAYYYYDIDVYRILLFKQSDNEHFIRYKHSNKMDIVPLQIKKIFFYNKIENHKILLKILLVDNIKYIDADILKNTNFVKSNCLKDKIIIVQDSVINDILIASLLEIRKYEDQLCY